jgi:(p)ppGpp synthase/HD superfamily hydrolase
MRTGLDGSRTCATPAVIDSLRCRGLPGSQGNASSARSYSPTEPMRASRARAGGETAIPYISHLLGVCSLVIEAGGSEDEAIAALLHDAAEDQGGEEMLDRIEAEFGPDVRRVVDACSDTLEQPKPPWRARKEDYIAKLASKRDDELRVSLADKVHNAERSCSTTEHLGRQSSTASKPAATRHSGTTRSSRMRSPSDSRGHSPTSLRG